MGREQYRRIDVTKYLLVSEPTGVSAESLGRTFGMRAFDTSLGTMLEQPKPFDMHRALDDLDRALNPNRCRCASRSVFHHPGCPAANFVT